ncbi:hypothetical protein B0H19DRAFT_1058863 [Mycena capillaripes]|nr:hypothetical protein B0H19DRAFT_1058863 [Mycena capillaripes]
MEVESDNHQGTDEWAEKERHTEGIPASRAAQPTILNHTKKSRTVNVFQKPLCITPKMSKATRELGEGELLYDLRPPTKLLQLDSDRMGACEYRSASVAASHSSREGSAAVTAAFSAIFCWAQSYPICSTYQPASNFKTDARNPTRGTQAGLRGAWTLGRDRAPARAQMQVLGEESANVGFNE